MEEDPKQKSAASFMRAQEVYYKSSESLSNKALLVFITVCSLSLFMLKGLGKGERVIELLGIGAILFFLLLYAIYYKGPLLIERRFSFFVILLALCVLASDISSLYFNNQPIKLTFYQQRDFYYIFLYFLIHFLNPKESWIKDFIYYVAIICAVIYILQYFAYPQRITEAQMFLDRGTIRINLPGIAFRHLGFFLCVTELFRKFSYKYAIGAVFLLIVTVLSAFRSNLAMYILLPSIYLLIGKYVKNRLVIIATVVVIGISGFFAFQGIIEEMNRTALKESSEGEKNIRIRAATFFWNDIKHNEGRVVFGNGVPSPHSGYGTKIASYMINYGYYLSDVGIVGSLYKFGLIYSVVIVILLFTILFKKLSAEFNYIKMFIAMQILLLFSTYPFFDTKSGIVVLVFILYLIDSHNSHDAGQVRPTQSDNK